MNDIYEEIQRLRQSNESAALATLISISGSTPRSQGSKMLIRQDGDILGSIGGGILEARMLEEARHVIRKGIPKLFDFDLADRNDDGMICGGKAKIYIEPIVPLPTLFIFGGGHISFYLSRIGKMAGFRVVVIDDRKEYANPERFPEVDQTIACNFTDVFSQLTINDFSYVIIVTRGHAYDQTVLEWAAGTDARYIGMIGSRTKIKKTYENLAAKGFSEDSLNEVHAPIGIDINAETPEEIAVSIIAEVINIRRSGNTHKKSLCIA